ncbi:MAG: ABC transporter ATP-binding protein [Armatimonadota bacterium]|nr:ABC transporter ATP-binding protein [Armatimonadota bacterium]MDR7448279.1 ABC transporter ATP-binding protein [Armatimonadota bacterium]MDR7458309.1 ABC transporter ATP-binding protein [Armatimonadota bacterium]MDR7478388.1 ABC transporter ATP-binding protein [Armatimonadota bacterium]MDR7487322.1 ABC transporter ATP-binding protein [Armatimonadota bacterium]
MTQQAVGIALERVSKRYRARGADILAVEGVSLAVRPGEFVALVGPSGCGKSTLLLMIAGLIPPTGGTIAVDGQVRTRPYTDVGVVFQRDALLEWRTVLGNVLLPAEIKNLSRAAAVDRARQLLQRVGLAGFEHRYPHELSGGMRQRVALCRALIHDPPLLLMDEPFAALDAFTREELGTYLLGLWQDRQNTVVFVTHAIEEAVLLADRVVVMSPRPGRVVQSVEVPLGRPRTPALREEDAFHSAVRRIRDLFRSQGLLGPPGEAGRGRGAGRVREHTDEKGVTPCPS